MRPTCILEARTSDCKCKSRNKSWVRSHHPPTQWNLTGRQMKLCWKRYNPLNCLADLQKLCLGHEEALVHVLQILRLRLKTEKKGQKKPLIEIFVNSRTVTSGWIRITLKDPDPVWHPGACRLGSGSGSVSVSISTKCKANRHWRKNAWHTVS